MVSRKSTKENSELKDTLEKDEKSETEAQTVVENQVEQSEKTEGSQGDKQGGKEQQEESLERETSYEQELEKSNDRLLRLQAEFLNYKRRVEKEKADLYSFGCEDLAKDLLPVIDNLERALSTLKEQDQSVYQGIDMVKSQLMQTLNKHEITEIEALGQPFDMHLHHAVMTEPCETKEQENTVAEVMQKGYMLKNRVLRPSMVKVFQS